MTSVREKNLLAYNNNEDFFFSKGKMNSAYPSIPPEERLRRIVILNLIRKIQKNFRHLILKKNSKISNDFAKNSIVKVGQNNQNLEVDNLKGHSYQNTQEKGKLFKIYYNILTFCLKSIFFNV
jgi:hypothetical protein